MENNNDTLQKQLAACTLQLNRVRKELEEKKTKVEFYEKKQQKRQKKRQLRTDSLRSVINGFADPFFTIDTDLKIQMFNKAALDYSNLSYEKIIGQPDRKSVV